VKAKRMNSTRICPIEGGFPPEDMAKRGICKIKMRTRKQRDE
jgi:hypothetical protein